jgi:DNA-binding NarL/FixJ family response regulator
VPATGAPAALRVSIGEDDVLLREGIARILRDAGLDVVAQVGDAEELVRRTVAYRPDVAIIDVQMPPRREDDGLLAAVELRRRVPDTGVLILSQYCEPAFAVQLIGDRPEGVGYLLKERVGDVATFTDAIRRVASGGSALDSEVVRRMMGRRAPGDALRSLTPRELAVLAAMAEGKSNLGVAQTLVISQAAVEKYVTAIFRKLPIAAASTEHRRVQAVLMFLRQQHTRNLCPVAGTRRIVWPRAQTRFRLPGPPRRATGSSRPNTSCCAGLPSWSPRAYPRASCSRPSPWRPPA